MGDFSRNLDILEQILVENIFEALHADRMSGYSGWFLVNQSEKEDSRAVTCQCLGQAGQDWKSG